MPYLSTVQVQSEFKIKILGQNWVYGENLGLLTLKTKNWCNNVFSRRFGKYSFEILQITWKKWNNVHQTTSFQFFINRSSILMFFVLFFHVVCKISNFNKWTAKHLTQASCTELTLLKLGWAKHIWGLGAES